MITRRMFSTAAIFAESALFYGFAEPSLAQTSGPGKSDQVTERKVAFVLSQGAVMIDFTGPWQVFQSATLPASSMDNPKRPFALFTVAEAASPIKVSGGMQIIPDHTFDNAPQPDIIVVPAQRGATPGMFNWLRSASQKAELTMSVCNGAFVLAEAGLLDGKAAALHHGFYHGFAAKYPKVQVKRGVRFVDAGKIATAAGLTSGIDLALHVVARFDGPEVAEKTANMLEHESLSWQNPEATKDARWLRSSASSGGAGDVVCGMNVSPDSKAMAVHQGKTYRFCSEQCKRAFAASPERYLK